jgi:hypothetical protein
MAKKIEISTSEKIAWPASCAACRSKENLTLASATSGRVTSVSPSLTGAVKFESEILDISFPVCQRHSKGLNFANFMTRNTAGLKFLRVLIYFFGILSIPSVIMYPIKLIKPSQTGMNISVEMILLNAAFLIALIVLIRSFMKLPIRIDKQTANSLALKFRNDLYAVDFVKLNPQSTIS